MVGGNVLQCSLRQTLIPFINSNEFFHFSNLSKYLLDYPYIYAEVYMCNYLQMYG